jgi:FkbM family methyltransferase
VIRLRALRLAERLAAPLRRLGLGRPIEAIRLWTLRRMGRFSMDVEGVTITGQSSVHISYVRELVEEAREGYMAQLFVEAVRPGMTVLDVGAHLGYFTLQAARRVGPAGRVLAAEPNPNTLPFLRANIEANGVADRVTIVERALGAAPGRAEFYVSPAGDTSSLHAAGQAAHTPTSVEVTTADAALGDVVLDVVKMDVEGGEVDVLDGMRETLARAAPGLVLFAECNGEALARAGRSADELMARLRALGLDPQVIDEERRVLAPADGVDLRGGYVNLRCARAAAR